MRVDSGWDLQFELLNRERAEQAYRIRMAVDQGVPHEESILIPGDGAFTFRQKIDGDHVEVVNVTIYKNQESTPFEQATYFLKWGTSN